MKRILLFLIIIISLTQISYSIESNKSMYYINHIENFYTSENKNENKNIQKLVPQKEEVTNVSENKPANNVEANIFFELGNSIFKLFILTSIILPFIWSALLFGVYFFQKKFLKEKIVKNKITIWIHFLIPPINFILGIILMKNAIIPINFYLTFLYYLFLIFKFVFKVSNEVAFKYSFFVTAILSFLALGIFKSEYLIDKVNFLI